MARGEDVVRISSDATVRISDDPIGYGTVSSVSGGEETYAYFPFEITLPQDDGSTVPKIRLTVPNISAEIGWWLRGSLVTPIVTVTLVSSADLDTAIATFPDFEMSSFSAGTMSIQGDLSLPNLEREPFPAGTFNPSCFPGIF
ncbi:MAG: hypothetical protein A2169_01090 [Deltaproteobacteria bacterium RBG_13_47_9]|nr:MAG: hypothetical protein A2169_01090 [Deltaproteobacteria bacterium RBG_13_47_9]